jgi:hypothetical protein
MVIKKEMKKVEGRDFETDMKLETQRAAMKAA